MREHSKFDITLIFFLSTALIIGLWLLAFFVLLSFDSSELLPHFLSRTIDLSRLEENRKNIELRAQIGDSFAPFTALITSLGFSGIIASLLIQQRQINQQADAIKMERQVSELQLFHIKLDHAIKTYSENAERLRNVMNASWPGGHLNYWNKNILPFITLPKGFPVELSEIISSERLGHSFPRSDLYKIDQSSIDALSREELQWIINEFMNAFAQSSHQMEHLLNRLHLAWRLVLSIIENVDHTREFEVDREHYLEYFQLNQTTIEVILLVFYCQKESREIDVDKLINSILFTSGASASQLLYLKLHKKSTLFRLEDTLRI